MIRFLAASLLALSSLTAAAADPYVIDPSHTSARFAINHQGFSTTHGRFEKSSGTVSIDPAAKKGSVDVTIEASSVSTGVAALDEHLRKPDFFDVARFPTITFKSNDFRFEGDRLVAVNGNLTLHGVTRPVSLKVDSFVCKTRARGAVNIPACGADASATLKRSDFGMTQYLGMLGDEVTIGIQIEAQQNPPQS